MSEIANESEILIFLTRVMREESPTSAMKAAELLGKRMGLFTEKEESMPAPIIIDNISEEVNA